MFGDIMTQMSNTYSYNYAKIDHRPITGLRSTQIYLADVVFEELSNMGPAVAIQQAHSGKAVELVSELH